MSFAEILSTARKQNNYDKDATAGGLWTDTTHYRVTCPVGKRWFLIGGTIYRTQNGTATTQLYDASDNIILRIDYEAAGTGYSSFPNNVAGAGNYMPFRHPVILENGEYIETVYGIAQDANAFESCQVLEIDL